MEMTKSQTVGALVNMGYDAVEKNGLVVIYIDEKDYLNGKKYKKLMENIGYTGSYGLVPKGLKDVYNH